MAVAKKKIYGAFKYQSYADRINKDWSKKNVGSTLYEISKIANNVLFEKNTHSVDIMLYDHKKMKWELVTTKFPFKDKF
jgi:hypothetical protein